VSWNHSSAYYGSGGFINVWDAGGPATSSETNISQVAMFWRGSGAGESVEAGKIEYPDIDSGSSSAYFFTFFNNNNWGAEGNWTASYNARKAGWQQSGTKAPGMSLTSSVGGGTQQEIYVEIRRNSTNDWWIWLNDEWIGYYPNCKQLNCANGTLFTSSGMLNTAANIYWYGEVYDSSAPAATTTDMGSGQWAAVGGGYSAYLRNMLYYPTINTWTYFGATPALAVTDSNCYTGDGVYTSTLSNWQNYFNLGGPGKGGSCM
jgi:hypothetical protein